MDAEAAVEYGLVDTVLAKRVETLAGKHADSGVKKD
jgi:ATP-dependent protease ClpP protease subunit